MHCTNGTYHIVVISAAEFKKVRSRKLWLKFHILVCRYRFRHFIQTPILILDQLRILSLYRVSCSVLEVTCNSFCLTGNISAFQLWRWQGRLRRWCPVPVVSRLAIKVLQRLLQMSQVSPQFMCGCRLRWYWGHLLLISMHIWRF
jgi:hypothetical protein